MSRSGTQLGWVIFVGAVAGLALAIYFESVSPLQPGESPTTVLDVLWGTSFLGFPAVGALIVSRDRRNPIGWLLLAIGFFLGFGLAANEYPDYAYLGRPHPLPGRAIAAVLSSTMALSFGALPLLLVLFPTGRFDTRPSRYLGIAAVIGVVGVILSEVFLPGEVDGIADLDNPLGVPALAGALTILGQAGMTLVGATAAASPVRLLWRLRGASGEERQQLRWFAYAVSAAIFVLGAAVLLEGLGVAVEAFGVAAFIVALNLVAGSLGVSVLKYRLYDIDVVISRTVVFAGLAAFITAIYVGIVVGVGSLLGAGGEPNLALSIVATAVVAVAFQPVRERLTRLANRLVFGKRATPYEVLSRFSSHLGETVATEDTLQRMARLLADGTGAAHAQVSLAIGGQMIPAASVGKVADASTEAHTVEVTHQGETLGALSVTKKRGENLTPADVKLVDDLAAQAGLLLRNVRLTEELKQKIVDLRASRQRLVAAQDAERRRLERDLHDGAQQQIVAIKLKLGIAKTLAAKEDAPKTAELIDQLSQQTDEAVQTLRELAHGIYPPLLAAEGLQAAIATAARRAPVPVTVETDGIGRYDQDVEAAVYFCVLEAITNAAKYASPSRVVVRLQETDTQLTFEVSDDGTGFDPDTTAHGHGLTNMTDRLDALGGHLEIDSAPRRGTRVAGAAPVVRAPQVTT